MYHPSKFRKDYTSIDFDKAVTGHPLEKKTKLICAKIFNFYRHSKPTKSVCKHILNITDNISYISTFGEA